MKSERLKKLETELQDLEQWLKLGLVPKKEIARHKEEITNLKARIAEEKKRLQFLKESGAIEEYTTPRRSPSKTVYPETPTFTEFEIEESEPGIEYETEVMEYETQGGEETLVEEEEKGEAGGGAAAVVEEEAAEEEEEEDPFSDRNRWRRGGITDPDATEW